MGSRVFIVEDNDEMRMGYALLIEDEPDLTLCGMVATAAAALEEISEATPDVVLIDVSLPDMLGIDLLRRLRTLYPDLLMLIVSGHDEAIYVKDAMDAGARGYLLKHQVVERLPEAIRIVVEGGNYLSPLAQAQLSRPTAS